MPTNHGINDFAGNYQIDNNLVPILYFYMLREITIATYLLHRLFIVSIQNTTHVRKEFVGVVFSTTHFELCLALFGLVWFCVLRQRFGFVLFAFVVFIAFSSRLKVTFFAKLESLLPL